MLSRIAKSFVITSLLLFASSANAGHHLWNFTEVFSNSDGSVQYIEMIGGADGEAGVGPFTITAGANTFDFVTNLPNSTTGGKWMLIATSNFAALTGGITPDYILAASFFSTAGGTFNYAGGADIWVYPAVPTDGVDALQRDGSSATNSPTNFAEESGSVDLSAAVPSIETWGIVLLIGALLLGTSGLLRRSTA